MNVLIMFAQWSCGGFGAADVLIRSAAVRTRAGRAEEGAVQGEQGSKVRPGILTKIEREA